MLRHAGDPANVAANRGATAGERPPDDSATTAAITPAAVTNTSTRRMIK
jgi:hypothetical protein